MRKYYALASLVSLLATANIAHAQIEPRMSGVWNSGDSGQILHIQPDGRYQTKVNDKVVDSGKLTGSNGSWKLKSDSGRNDAGTFSFIGGNMHLHGGAVAGTWNRSGSPNNSANSSTPSASLQTPPTNLQTPTSTSVPPNSPLANSPHNSQSYSSTFRNGQRPELPGYANKNGTESPSNPEHISADGRPAPPAKKGWAKTIGQYVSGAANQLTGPASSLPNGNDNSFGNGKPNYSNSGSPHYRNNTGYNTAPGVNGAPPTGDYVSNYWSKFPGKHVNASDINKVGTGMPQNQTTDHWDQVQWQNRPATPGWRKAPRNGYIPVMGDGRARKYWGH